MFCVRVADWKPPLFRYVGPDDGGTPVADTLACLDRARPRNGLDTPRVLDDDTYRQALTPGRPLAPMSSTSGTT